jgi:hypothetical protein
MANPLLCSHIKPGTTPFETLFVLEEHLGLASGLVECRSCGATYLLELIDLVDHDRAYRVTNVDPAHAGAMIRTLSRGTCDIHRAQAEVQNLEGQSALLDVTLSMLGNQVTGVVQAASTREIPKDHWRNLPCDGRWIA